MDSNKIWAGHVPSDDQYFNTDPKTPAPAAPWPPRYTPATPVVTPTGTPAMPTGFIQTIPDVSRQDYDDLRERIRRLERELLDRSDSTDNHLQE